MKQILLHISKHFFFISLLLALLIMSNKGFGQTTGDYRSAATGNWSTLATWQRYNGTTWATPTGSEGTPTSASGVITIQTGNTVTVTANVTVDQVTVNANGQITIINNHYLRLNNGTGTDIVVYGTILNQDNSSGYDGFRFNYNSTLSFESGGIYQHGTNGGTIPTATWNAASICNITGITTTIPTVASFAQSFGNFTWNCTSQTGDLSLAQNLTTIYGNLTISSTGTGSLRLVNGNGNGTISVAGDYSQTAGTLYICGTSNSSTLTLEVDGNFSLSTGTLNINGQTGTGTLNVAGDFTMNSGTITETNTGTANVNFNRTGTQTYSKTGGTISNIINFNINSGSILDVGTSLIDGSTGTFTLSSGAGIITAHAQGLSTTAGTGSIQVTGTKTYNTGANYTYDGIAAQVTGNGLPATVNNLTINNSTGVTLTNSTTVSGALNLTNGILTTGANTVTVTNYSTSAVTGGSTSNFVNGPLIWTLAPGSTYSFPVGKGTTYLPFGLTGITGTAPQIKAEAFTGTTGGTAISPLGSLSTTEYWLATVAGGTYTTGSVSLTRQTALAGLDAIGRNTTTLNGAYTTLDGTVSGTSIINSDVTGNSLGYFVMAAKISITTGTISPTTYCAGASVSVPFTITGTFTSGNVFTAQLSNTTGDFGSPVNIGSITQTTAVTIPATILAGTTSGTGYKIRVVSSIPVVTGTNNVSDITINALTAPTTTNGLICIGSTATLSASGATTGGVYKWFDAATNGNLLKTSANDADNTFITPVLAATTNYWVSILNAAGCEGSRTLVAAIYPSASTDNQSSAGTNSWIGHVYDGTGFNTYYGSYTEPETFDQNFGGNTNCFVITSNSTTTSIYTETFSVRYRMNSTKKGFYVVDLGSDDGSRLTVDGTLLFNNWNDQSFTSRSGVLMNLNGASSLVYEFYENGGENRVVFQNLTLVLANTLSTYTTQTICLGNAGSAIGGDSFGTLPSGISLSGTGYQWAYSTTSVNGLWTDILGATSASYTPSTTVAPFNTTGTYYFIRKAVLTSANNLNPNPYTAANESNAATITVYAIPQGSLTANGPFCDTGAGQLTWTATSGTGPFTVVYNDGTADRTQTNVTSGIAFNVIPTPVTSTTTYTLVSVTGVGGCIRNSGFTGASATITVNITPQGSLTANGPFCATGAGQLTWTSTSGVGPYTVVYYDGTANRTQTNVTSGTAFNVFTTPVTSTTTYTLVSVTGTGGCIRNSGFTGSSVTITINTLPAQPSVITGSTTPCQASSQTYSVTNVSGANYTWVFPAGWTQTGGGTTNSVTVTVGANSGNIQVTPSNTCGNGTPRLLSVTPTAIPAQPGAITGSTTPCQGSSQTYSVTNVGGVTYNWTFPAGWSQTGGGTTNSVTVTVGAGSGNIMVTPGNACGNGTPRLLSVTTIAIPAQPGAITGSTTPCQGSSQTYSVANVGGVTYNWTFPAGWTQTGGGTTNSVIVTVGANSGDITVTPGTTCGNGTARTLAVIVSTSVPAQPGAINGSTTPCLGSSKTYSVTNVDGTIYNWIFPAGWTQTGGGTTNSVTVTVGANSGNITVTPGNGCGTGTAQTLAVTVAASVPAQPSAITGSTTPTQYSSQTYSVTNVPGLTYNWTFPAGWTQTGGGTSNSVTVTVGATGGSVQVTPSNDCGNGTARILPVTITLGCISSQPTSITVCSGNGTSFSIATNGTGYHWQRSINNGGTWTDITSAGTNPTYAGYNTSKTLTLTNVVVGNDGYQYRCYVTSCGIYSNAATLNVGFDIYSPRLSASPDLITPPETSSILSLTNTQIGLNYQLKSNVSTSEGSTVAGNGGTISFASVSPATSSMYSVIATSISSGCRDTINDKKTVVVNEGGIIIDLHPCNGLPGLNFFTNSEFGTTATNRYQIPDQTLFPGVVFGNPLSGYTGYTYGLTNNAIPDGNYVIANSTAGMYRTPQQAENRNVWLLTGDRSSTPGIGLMYIVNAGTAPSMFYTETINNLCENTRYEFSAEMINLYDSVWVPYGIDHLTYFPVDDQGNFFTILPNVDFLLDGKVVFNTGNMMNDGQWNKYGFTFQTPIGMTSVTLSMRNNSKSGIGNDLAIDNIIMRSCGPVTSIRIVTSLPVCPGVPVEMSAVIIASDFVTPEYQWQKSTDNGVNWSNITGANSDTYINSTPYYGDQFRFIVGETATNLSNPNCYYTSNADTITTTAGITGTTPGSVCGPGTVVLGATGTPGSTINWYASLTGGTSLKTGNSYSPAISTTTTFYVEATYGGCISNPRTPVVATVNSSVTASVSISANTGNPICTGTSVTFTATPTNGGATPSYQWKLNGGNVGTNSPTYTTSSLPNGNTIISCIMSSSLPNCVTGSPAPSNNITMTVATTLAASVSITANTGNTICQGTSVTFTAVATNGGATPTYQWTKNGTAISGANSNNYTTSSLVQGDIIRCIMTSSFSCATGSATSAAITMTVNPLPAINLTIGGTGTVCSGTGTNVTVAVSVSGVNYQLRNGSTNVGSVVAGTGGTINLPTGNLTTTTTFNVMATRTTTGVCSAQLTGTATITVNPLPTLTGASQVAIVCAGSTATINLIGLLANSISTVAYSINGTAQTPVSGVVANSSGTASFTTTALSAANNGQILQITGITITNSTPNCNAIFNMNVTLSVYTASQGGTASSDQTICSGSSPSNITLTGYAGTIQWQSSTDNITFYNISGATATPLTSAQMGTLTATTLYRAVVTSGFCSFAYSNIVMVTVNAQPIWTGYNLPTPTSLCLGGTVSFSVSVTGGLGGTISWIRSNNITPGIGTEVTVTTGDSPAVGIWYYRPHYAPTGSGCTLADGTQTTVTVDATPISPTLSSASPVSGSIICTGYNSGTATFSGGSGGGNNEYQYSIDGGTSWNTYTNSAAITTTGATTSVLVRARRSGGACTASAYNTYSIWTVGSTLTAPTLNTATPISGTAICLGFSPSATITAGSGGSSGAADLYQYSIDGGTNWSAYVSGNPITTTGATTSVQIRVSRSAGSYGCSATSPTTIVTWPVASASVAPTLSMASPANGSTVCAGYNTGTITGTGGSGGSGGAANEYQVSINNGSTYSAYTSGNAITTTGATGSVIVQSRRTGGSYGCSNSAWSTISTWTVGLATVNPTLNVATPANGTAVCAGYNGPSVTITAGSGGSSGATDLYQYSIDGGTNWSTYVSGNLITTTTATGSVMIRVNRSAGSYGCSATGPTTIVTWPVSSATVNPTLNTATPANGTAVCAGYNGPSVTITAGSGGSSGATDLYQYSIDGGTNWSTYVSGNLITTTTATGSVMIRVSRSAGSYGCSATGPTVIITWPVNAPTVNPALNTATPASTTPICAGYSPSATITAGSGGSSGATDLYQYSIDNGVNWTTYVSGASITTTGATGNVLIRVSRSAGSYGCSATSPTTIVTWPVNAPTVNPTLLLASPASTTPICAGYSPSATITAGSGGSSGAADLYQYSINNGVNWTTYVSGASITTAGATGNVLIRVSRSAGSYGCSATGPTTIVTWPVNTPTVNPTLLLASPASTTPICAGYSPSATITAGSGGSSGAADLYQYSINNGVNWTTYVSGASITTAGATGNVLIRISRSAGSYGCSATGPTTIVTWPVNTPTVNPTLGTATPASGTAICAGFSPNATITAGSGGSSGAADLYQYSIDGGTIWSTYVSGNPITTTGATGSVKIQVSRSAGSYGCSATGPTTIVTWPVNAPTVNPTLLLASPASTTPICAGYSPNATITAGSGGSSGAADLYEYSINNGGSWTTYVSGASITTTGATGNVLIRVSRSAGSYGCSATGPTTIVTWPVSAQPTWTNYSYPFPTSLCLGGTVSFSVSITGGLGGTVTWIRSSSPGGAGTTVTTGDSPAVGTWYYRPHYTPTGSGCTLTDGTQTTVTVVADPTLSQPSDVTICKGGNTTLTTTPFGGTGIFSYQWQYCSTPGGTYTNVVNGTPSNITYSGGTTTSLTLTGDGSEISEAKYYKCVLTTFTPAGAGCDAITTTITVTTVDDPNITTQPTSPADICAGGTSADITITAAGGTPSLIYQWQYYNGSSWNNVVNGTPAGSIYAGATGKTFSVSGISAAGAYQYQCVVSATGSGCGSVISNAVTVTIRPTPTAAISGTTTVCQNAIAPIITFTNPQNLSVTITYNINGANQTTINLGASTTTTVAAPTITGGLFAYNLVSVIYQSDPSCSNIITGTATVTVTPTVGTPIFTLGATSSRCRGAGSITYDATATDNTGITYSLDGASITGGNSIIPGTGAVTYDGGWSGVSIITASANGCNGPATSIHTVTTIGDQIWTGTEDTNWNNAYNWSCIFIPDLKTNVLIPDVTNHNYPILSAGLAGMTKNIVIESGSSLTVIDNTLQIAGAITNAGTFTASAGTIEMKGTAAQSIGTDVFSGNTIMNLTNNNSAGTTLQGPLNVTGIVLALNGNLTSGGNLTLISTAIQTALIDGTGSGQVLGNVTMQRYLPSAFGYKYFSSPFQSATVNEFADDLDLTATFPTFYKYDENEMSMTDNYLSHWTIYTASSGTLTPLRGYAANFGESTAPKTVDINGVVNNSPIQVDLWNHNNQFSKGFNLVGNPYPSPIDWKNSNWIKTNIDDAIYFFKAGSTDQYMGVYSSYVNGVSSDGTDNDIIPAMQGFFVHVSDGAYPVNATLGVTNSVRINNLNPTFKNAFIDDRPILRFTANLETKNALDDGTVIYFDNSAKLSFDQDLDALKMTNTDIQIPNLYTLTPESIQLSINAMPYPSDSLSIVPLGITTFTDGWVNLKASDLSQLPNDLHIYLVDAETGKYRDLKQLPEYRFYLKAGEYDRRFTLIFSLSDITEPKATAEKLFTLSRSGSYLSVKTNLAPNTKGNLMVTNILGQVVLRREVFEKETVEINSNISTGVYIVTIISGKKMESEKILMRKDYE